MSQLPDDIIFEQLTKIIKISKKYGYADADSMMEKLDNLKGGILHSVTINEVIHNVTKYQNILKAKNYDYFNNNKIELSNQEMSNFIYSKWKLMSPKDKKSLFRSMIKIYNAGILITQI